ncbi:aminotransferase class I/II-fold pyridoxal phosphate-dependent enzyme [Legionella pneumophila]|uniref:aminotransferase class I/II-fold pyridoxal phosphate-dependent enzyme n=1 Tax=Legionella pneumophila TaxID=446 RepID=UPI000D0824C3|nr:aminotransferase class I/II-fold pyridoxal phosphate-dependent enzyme [Legionella pneumophila]RYB34323.1 aminotransferase class I/II-fold pyridoxal phosphate-dependent enzyme [Legionella pneumophila]RYB44066.1 aminotransferase class I/II-fold pyridoxal phosphate-dependent enzyme [Legionella pneumophila]RYB72986.1 aminotransferase class I/II-fold pyridoxal phosphate-dependent enzyme [Legionella pneumophila]RYB73995.1 aminotransferase class I/II-fold pyridoxal phosphate-dependent enzyme [Legio
MITIKELYINKQECLKTALRKLDATAQGVLFLVDSDECLIRTVTDGDIRRLLLKGFTLDSTLEELSEHSSKALPVSATIQDAYHLMQEYELDHIPVIDESNRPIRLIHRRELSSNILLSSPHIGEHEQQYVQEAFATNWVAPLGPNVDSFEKEVAEYINTKSAVALSSGTAAIHLALVLLDVKPGDIVFASSFTFVATVNPILYQGATPVFIDSDLDTWNMSPVALERALRECKAKNQMPKAVIIVNLYGQSANYDALCQLCNEYNVPIIEDAAESLGATYNNKHSGTFGKLGVFSFNGNKIITTSGGGMLVSEDENLIQRARFLSTQAREPVPHYEHTVVGYNYRMSNVLAGIGRGQLKVLEKRVKARRAIFDQYKQALESYPFIDMMPEINNGYSTRWLSTLVIKPTPNKIRPEDVIAQLKPFNIEARRTWKPMHKQPLFAGSKYYPHDEQFSVSDYLFDHGICLPSGSNLSSRDIDRVIHCLNGIFKSKQNVAEVM